VSATVANGLTGSLVGLIYPDQLRDQLCGCDPLPLG